MGTLGFNIESGKKNWEEGNAKTNEVIQACIIGETGAGKSLKAQDLISHRMKQGHGILLFDGKQVLESDLLLLIEDTSRIYKLGIENGGAHSIKLNLFSHVTQSEQHIKNFTKALLVGEDDGSGHLFWSQTSKILLDTLMITYSSLNKFMIYVSKMIGKDIEFSTSITYKKGEEEKEVPFSISSTPLTFEEFYSKISIRTHFRHIAANINKITEHVIKKITGYINTDNLSREDALQCDKFIHTINKYSKIMATYILPEKEDFSGTSGSYFGMILGINSTLYTDKSLNNIEDSHDVKKLLEEGNCVICLSDDQQTQEFIFTIYAEHFSLRSSMVNPTPISLVIDESNLFFGKGSSIDLEHYLTFSRSSKLSIVSLWQSKEQLFETFGANNAESILQNTTQIILSEKRDSKYFYYTVNDDDTLFRFDPKLSTEHERYTALKAFQEQNNEFTSIQKKESEVVLWNHTLHNATEQVNIVDIDTLNSRTVKYIADEEQYHGYFMNKFADNICLDDTIINEQDDLLDDLLEDFGIEF